MPRHDPGCTSCDQAGASVRFISPPPQVRGLRSEGRTSCFEPDLCLAIALRADEVSQLVDELIGTELGGPRSARRHPWTCPGPDGWVLIAVEGFPLGWGKRSGGVVKNHYPKALRRG